jgi:hypothetical protein
MLEFGISQMIPFPGKRDLQRKIAEEEALAAADSVEEARLAAGPRGQGRLVAAVLLRPGLERDAGVRAILPAIGRYRPVPVPGRPRSSSRTCRWPSWNSPSSRMNGWN